MLKKHLMAITTLLLIMMAAPVIAQEKPIDNSEYILTPKAPDTPRINGARIYGARPGADFLFRIPATGIRPMVFSAQGLPKGLKLDRSTGIISGKAKKKGTYHVKLKAENSLGAYERELRIVIGDKIALTPPMGWNSWNCWGPKVSQEKVMSSARAMIEKGLADYGWSYINTDDGWQAQRGGKYNAIQPNRKFPDMKGMVDELHAMGLKAGIYSGPWYGTFAGFIGSACDNPEGKYKWQEDGFHDDDFRFSDPEGKLKGSSRYFHAEYSFADKDARQWADWGFDYLKYDWNPIDYWHIRDIHNAIEATGRDIVLSLSNSAKVSMGPGIMQYAQCWRTTADIVDTWKSISTIGFQGQDMWSGFKRPGNWPDADMLVVGKVGWGHPKPSRLTPDEQYTHISLWALLSSPMLIGCDMADMDDFTISLLCNNEVIDVNQDPLGFQAACVEGDENYRIYVKPIEDGTIAVGLFNLTEAPSKIGFVCKMLGILGEQTVRDLWRQKDIAKVPYKERWETEVAPHGVVLLKVSPGATYERPMGNNR